MGSELLLAACAALALSAPAQDTERPNVVVIITDDQGWADIGYNNPAVHSPRLDALAAEGLVFERHYVMPQCTPTRVALMTGRYPSRFGPAAQQASNAGVLPLGTPTMASVLQGAGYATHLVGKWHIGSTPDVGPNAYGFESSYGSLAGAIGMYDHRYRKGKFAETWQRDGEIIDGWENGVHATDLVAREAVRTIEEAGDGPFFLYVAFHAVHTPLDERGRFVDRPTQLDPDDPTRWLDEDEIEWFHDPSGTIQAEEDPEKRLLLAAVNHLDHAVGEIVDALERTGQREETLLLFTSDNGPQVNWGGNAYPDDLKLTDFNQPLPVRGHKTQTWEGGIHVPGFAVWPGRIAPGRDAAPMHVVDWLPTVAAIAGVEEGLPTSDGDDLSSAWLDPDTGATSLGDRTLYWVWSVASSRWALRHGDWKLVRNQKGPPAGPEGWQLYNLADDPRETTDLAGSRPEVLARMHERFLAERALDAAQ